ncbi:MAG: DUF2996 domain-containing protein [Spirulina sp. DLM2.Bin59]|nr:MAG: DUF2996 domain-containing protein [Spirulina sp. DLM2.Bin59]
MTETDKAQAPAAKAKKEKPPAPEDKPFTEFMEQDFLPTLKTAFTAAGLTDMDLAFVKKPVDLTGFSNSTAYWQVEGQWQQGARRFNLYWFDESLKGQKGFSATTYGSQPSTLESFMIDERKVTLDLIVLYTLQRINGEKWLGRN